MGGEKKPYFIESPKIVSEKNSKCFFIQLASEDPCIQIPTLALGSFGLQRIFFVVHNS